MSAHSSFKFSSLALLGLFFCVKYGPYSLSYTTLCIIAFFCFPVIIFNTAHRHTIGILPHHQRHKFVQSTFLLPAYKRQKTNQICYKIYQYLKMVNEVSSADVQTEYINRRHNINSTSTSRRSSGAATTQVLRSARTQKGPKNTNNAIFRAKKTLDSSRNPQIAPKSLMIFKSTYALVDFQTDVTRTGDTRMNGCSSLLTIACVFCCCYFLSLSFVGHCIV